MILYNKGGATKLSSESITRHIHKQQKETSFYKGKNDNRLNGEGISFLHSKDDKESPFYKGENDNWLKGEEISFYKVKTTKKKEYLFSQSKLFTNRLVMRT